MVDSAPAAYRMLPGSNLVRLFFLLAFCSFVAFWWPGVWLVLCGVSACAFFFSVFDFYRMRRICTSINARRSVQEIVGRAQDFTVHVWVDNKTGQELFVELRDMLPAECGGEHIFKTRMNGEQQPLELTYSLSLKQRGEYEIGGMWGRFCSRWNLVALQWKLLPGVEIKVYPESLAPGGEFRQILTDQSTQKQHNIHKRGDGMEFDSLAPFSSGNDIRHIDWRASARQRSLLVRKHQVEQHRDVFVLLDCGRLMGADAGNGTKLDRGVDAALLLSQIALRRGDRCGFAVFDDKVEYFQPAAAGLAVGRQILQHVYSLRSEFKESDFGQMFSVIQSRLQKRSLIVIISDVAGGDSSHLFCSAMASLAKRHVVVFAALRTPLLGEYIHQPVDGYSAVCAKAVCLKMERERHQTLKSIGHTGIKVLDVLPEELTAPLINSYIDIRESGRL